MKRSLVVKTFQTLLLLVAFALLVSTSTAREPNVELLWRNGAPGAKGDAEGDKPTISIYLPEEGKATGAAIVVCPGGGYGHLAVDHEGRQVGEWLNSLGVTAFVLKYRHSANGYRHPIPLQDAQRAIRTVRARAAEWKLDPKQIGILGFSAGGHLASTTGTHFDAGKSDANDPIERVSSRPDLMVLVYPVISFTSEYTHKGSRKNLLGDNPDEKLVQSLSNDTQVTPDTPPTFLMHTSADTAVPPENSVLFYLALRKANVPAEMHIYETGQHGVGLAQKDPVLSTWPGRCADWLRLRGFLDKT